MRLSRNKEANCSLPTWQGTAKKNCLNIVKPCRRYALMSKLMSYTSSSVCLKKICCHEILRRGSSCVSLSLKGWTRQCMPQSSMTKKGIDTQRFTLFLQPSTLKEDCCLIPSTTTNVNQWHACWKKSLTFSLTNLAEKLCDVLPRRASGSSMSGQESSAVRLDFKRLLIRRLIVKLPSRTSKRD